MNWEWHLICKNVCKFKFLFYRIISHFIVVVLLEKAYYCFFFFYFIDLLYKSVEFRSDLWMMSCVGNGLIFCLLFLRHCCLLCKILSDRFDSISTATEQIKAKVIKTGHRLNAVVKSFVTSAKNKILKTIFQRKMALYFSVFIICRIFSLFFYSSSVCFICATVLLILSFRIKLDDSRTKAEWVIFNSATDNNNETSTTSTLHRYFKFYLRRGKYKILQSHRL